MKSELASMGTLASRGEENWLFSRLPGPVADSLTPNNAKPSTKSSPPRRWDVRRSTSDSASRSPSGGSIWR